MGMKMSEVGGGPATGLADDLVKFLQGGLQTGSFGAGTASQRMNGADPIANTQGIAGVLNDILMGAGGNYGGSINTMVQRETERNAGNLRARHSAGGGGSYGSSAAYGEALLRSESAPKIAQAVTGAQMGVLQMLMPIMAGLAGKGITQRENVATPSPWMTAAGIAGQIGGDVFKAFANPMHSAPSMSGGSASPNFAQFSMPNIAPYGAPNNGGNIFGNSNQLPILSLNTLGG